MTWSPTSWQSKPVQQTVSYGDPGALARVVDEMGRLPPLVTSWEVERLRDSLAHAAIGNAFVLQGGDCAESFDDCRADPIAAKLKILMQMSLVLTHGTRKHQAKHFAYAAGWKKFEPLWDAVIRARQLRAMTPLLEAVLSKVSRVCGSSSFRNDSVSFRNTAAHSTDQVPQIPQ